MLLLLTAGKAQAEDWFHKFTKNSLTSARRVNHWPQPFVYPDRRAAVAPFRLMVSKGWKAQNTVGAHLFDEETGELSEAGKLKIRSILADTPMAYRSIFVQSGTNREDTTRRVDVVQQYAVNIVTHGPLPPVHVTDQAPRMHPADYVDSINRRFTSSAPRPRLPEDAGGEQTTEQ
jgi:hypothetical protein